MGDQTSASFVEHLQQALDCALKMGVPTDSVACIGAKHALAIGKLKKALRAYNNKEISVKQLEQNLQSVKKAGVPLENQDYKDAEGVLQTEKQKAIDELNKALQADQTSASFVEQ